MENVAKMAEHVQVVLQHVKASSQKDQIRRYFNSTLISIDMLQYKYLSHWKCPVFYKEVVVVV